MLHLYLFVDFIDTSNVFEKYTNNLIFGIILIQTEMYTKRVHQAK